MTAETENSNEEKRKAPYNGLKAAYQEIARRLNKPVLQASFWFYIIVAVFGFGGLAIWIEIWRYYYLPITEADAHHSLDSLKLSLATAFPAVVGASALELVLNDVKIVRIIGLVFFTMCALLALYLLGFGHPSDEFSIFLGALGCMSSIFVWWVANGLDDIFQDEPNPEDAVGGDPKRDLASRATSIRT